MFGTQYVDEIVRWWRDGRGAMYVFQDANWNVTSTVSYMTQPLDRVRTTPYGEPTFDVEIVNGDWDDDGDTDSADIDACLDCFSVGDEGDCRIYDYDDNGTINLNDYFDLLALMPAGTSLQRQPGRRTSPNHFPFAHQGLVLDEETGSYQNRHRLFQPQEKRFVQRDPIVLYPSPRRNLESSIQPARRYGFVPQINLYSFPSSNPLRLRDPMGLCPQQDCIDDYKEAISGCSIWIDTPLYGSCVDAAKGTLGNCTTASACGMATPTPPGGICCNYLGTET